MVFLQYYVTESATGNRIDIEIDAAKKQNWISPGMAGRRFGIPTLFSIRKRKSMRQKQKLGKLSHWVPTVFSREAWLFILPIWKANRKVTQR